MTKPVAATKKVTTKKASTTGAKKKDWKTKMATTPEALDLKAKIAEEERLKKEAKPLASSFPAKEGTKAKKYLVELEKGVGKAKESCQKIVILMLDNQVPFSEVTQHLMALYPAWPVNESNGRLVGLSTMRKETAKDELKAFTNTVAYRHLNAFESTLRKYYMKEEGTGMITDKVKSTKSKGRAASDGKGKTPAKSTKMSKAERNAKMKADLINTIRIMEDWKAPEGAIKAIREAMGYLV